MTNVQWDVSPHSPQDPPTLLQALKGRPAALPAPDAPDPWSLAPGFLVETELQQIPGMGFCWFLALVVSGNLESGNLEMLIYNQVSCFFCFWKNNLYVGGTTLYPGVRSEARQFLFTNIQRWGASNNVHGKLGFNAHALLVSVSSCQALAQSLGRYSKLYNPGQRWHIARPQKMISIWYLQTSPGWRSSDGTCMKILRKSCPQLPCVYHSAWD